MEYTNYIFIEDDSTKDYLEIPEVAKGAKYITIDTEFSNEKHFMLTLSLLQIAIKDKNSDKIIVYIIDFQKINNIKPIQDILQDESICKVMHSCSQDVALLYNLGFTIKNLFDTQIALLYLNRADAAGLKNLISYALGEREAENLDKDMQRSDWLVRPLSKAQLTYAAYDVLYLYQALPILIKRLGNYYDYAKEDSEMALEKYGKKTDKDDQINYKKFHYKLATKKQRILCYKLLKWRVEEGFRTDTPTYKLLNNQRLLQIVDRGKIPKNITFLPEWEEEAIAVINEIASSRKNNIILDKFLLQKAAKIVARHCRDLNISTQCIATNKDLQRFFLGLKSQLDAKWRYELVGEELEKLRQQNAGLNS